LEKLQPAAALNHNFSTDLGLPGLLLTAAMITGIGCYASSLSGTVLQAIGAAIGFVLMSGIFISTFPRVLVAVAPKYFSWSALIATCFFLSYANFKQLRITWRLWLRNGLILLAVVYSLCAIGSCIYT
jgi:hypothetical protein